MQLKYKKAFLLCCVGTMVLASTNVLGGNINSAEQSVLNYLDQTFEVDGKNYQVSESAKNSAYEKFMQDDVDLSDAKAKAAIRQASKKIAQGVKSGYLVEVTVTEENNTEKSNTGQTSTEQTNTEQMNTEQSDAEQTDDGQRNTEQPDSGQSAIVPSDTETSDTEERDHSDANNSTEQNSEKEDTSKPEDRQVLKKITVKPKDQKLDIQKIKEEAAVNPDIVVEDIKGTDSTSFWVKVVDYDTGKVIIANEEGNVLFTSDLIVKNTGYDTRQGVKLLFVLFAGICITVLLSVRYICQKKEQVNEK